MEELKPNSHKYKEDSEKKKVEKVVTKAVKVKKKDEITRIKDMLGSTDIPNIKSYIGKEIIVPAFFNAIYDTVKAFTDAITDGTEIILFGNEGRRRKKKNKGVIKRESYRDYYEDDRFERRSPIRNRFQLDDLIFESKNEADNVLSRMEDVVETYGIVTVNDLYDMVDLTAPYTASSYGWTKASLSNAEIRRLPEGGYIIKLPKPKPVD